METKNILSQIQRYFLGTALYKVVFKIEKYETRLFVKTSFMDYEFSLINNIIAIKYANNASCMKMYNTIKVTSIESLGTFLDSICNTKFVYRIPFSVAYYCKLLI